MKDILLKGLIILTFLQSCGQATHQGNEVNIDHVSIDGIGQVIEHEIINPDGKTLQTRILPPKGFERLHCEDGSFADYLRNLPLLPDGSEVKLYHGGTKPNFDIYDAVVDLEIGNKDLHQCADAIIRLRAEYLWRQKQFDKIHFNFTNGFRVEYTEWMNGNRIVVEGNTTYWAKAGSPSNTYEDFWEYMEIIFTYAGTLSLSNELKSVNNQDLQIGDVFIQGGSPGHAILVVDMAIDTTVNKKVFLLAQSYMPAQQTHILKNPNEEIYSPWYSVDFDDQLKTPEWTFNKMNLKRFVE